MASFREISSTTIQAVSHNNGDSTHKIDLTQWDLQFLLFETIQKGLLFHHPNPVNTSNQIQHLKHSLSSTLSFFPPFAGRLLITQHEDNTATCFLACNNLGALFVHAAADNTTVSDILGPSNNYVPPIVHSFFPLNGTKNCEGTTQPLLAVQVTELLDGIFIGFTVIFSTTWLLGDVAWEMNKMISLYTDEKIRNHYESWLRTPRIQSLSCVTGGNSLATSSSPRFNVYGNDFGWGKPVAVRSGGANKRNGKITVFAGVKEGSIDIEACLPFEILEAMGNDPEF